MKKLSVRKILATLISMLILFYVGFNMYYSKASRFETETVTYTEAIDTYETDAYVIRNETIINYDPNKVINYIVEDSEAIAQDANVAYLFNTAEEAQIYSEINNLNREIKNLEEVSSINTQNSTNMDLINNQISKSMQDLGKLIDNKDFINAQTVNENLLYYLNKRQLVTGKIQNFDERISQIKFEIEQLEKDYHEGKVGDVTSPVSGYFVSLIDGYENTFDYTDTKNIDVDSIKRGLPKINLDTSSIAGKTISDLNWYVACVVSAEEAVKLPMGKEVTLSMPFASTQMIPAVVDTVNQKDIYNEAAIVLKCNYMNKELCHTRYEKIKIESDKYKGFKIPKSAIHIQSFTKNVKDENGNEIQQTRDVQGVYSVYGNELRFKEIIPLNSYADFVICSSDPQKNNEELFTGNAVQLYDEVVIGGVDLYDGKIIK